MVTNRIPLSFASISKFVQLDITRSATAKLSVQAVTVLSMVATTRLIFETVGTEVYAGVMLTAGLFVLLPFADMGTGAAVANAVAVAERPIDEPMVRRTLATSFRYLCATAFVLTMLGILVAQPPVGRQVLGTEFASIPGASHGLFLSIFLFAVSLPLGLSQRLLLGLRQNASAVLCQMVGPLTTLVGASIIISTNLPEGMLLALPGGSVLSVNLTTYVALWMSKYGDLATFLLPIEWMRRGGVRIWDTALPMILISSGLAISYQTDRLILSHVLGTSGVAEYSIVNQIYSPMYGIISTAGITLWPVFIRRRGSPSLRRTYEMALGAFAIVGAFCALAVLALGPIATDIMSGGVVRASGHVYIAFSLLILVQAVHLVTGVLLTDATGLRLQASTVGCLVATSLPLSIWWAHLIGVAGPVYASAVCTLVFQAVPCYLVARRRLANRGL